ncbi:MAG: type II secretion system F family protein [Candidatus Omnitrophica bacterium]|nr:type II secretion system F family protein [Candidatus Omnitrophota bacterium]
MLFFIFFILIFICASLGVLTFTPFAKENRPTLKLGDLGLETTPQWQKQKPKSNPFAFIRNLAHVNKPLVTGNLRLRLIRDLSVAHVDITPEEFLLIKQLFVVLLPVVVIRIIPPEMSLMAIFMSMGLGYILPDMWLRGKIKKVKDDIVKLLPDTVDLLGLCVNAGLDFMMALKWVVEKSAVSVLTSEMNNILQEISVGKQRRDALKDLARKYDLPDLSTFSRTLIQADKMGTSVSEALNILSEDMRMARFRRGEAMAMKAPLKMLGPLLFCIFPVVGILVGGPIFLDFTMNNPLKSLAH